jgi:hypothetical protein
LNSASNFKSLSNQDLPNSDNEPDSAIFPRLIGKI